MCMAKPLVRKLMALTIYRYEAAEVRGVLAIETIVDEYKVPIQ